MLVALGELVNLPQGSDIWSQVRRLCITGTEASSILNPGTWDTLDVKKKSAPSTFKNKAMERGNRLEPKALKSLERKKGIKFKPAVFMSKQERMLASLDGIALGRIATCEIKCPEKGQFSDTWIKAVKGEIPRNYYMQMQFGLLLSGAPVCFYWVYDEDLDDGVLIEVKREPFVIAEFVKNAREYWKGRVSRANKTVVYNDDQEALKHAEEYVYWKNEADRVKARLEASLEKIKKYSCEASDVTVIGDVELTRKESVGSVDYKKGLLELCPGVDLEEFRREPKQPYSVSIKVNNDSKGSNCHAENTKESA